MWAGLDLNDIYHKSREGIPGPAGVQGWPAGVWRGRGAHEEPSGEAGALAEENWVEGRHGLGGAR